MPDPQPCLIHSRPNREDCGPCRMDYVTMLLSPEPAGVRRRTQGPQPNPNPQLLTRARTRPLWTTDTYWAAVVALVLGWVIGCHARGLLP